LSATFAQLPPPGVAAFYVAGPRGQVGPMALETLLEQVYRGQIPPDAAVWYEGLPGWLPIREHPELRARLAAHGRGDSAPAAHLAGQAAPPSGMPGGPRSDDALDQTFVQLIKKSWEHFDANLFSSHVDEVFLGAVISSTLDSGYSLIDLTSDGSQHYLRFENLQDHTRVICRLQHLAASRAEAKVVGHTASVVIGYGERVGNVGRIWQAMKAEYKSGYIQSAEPGTITVDADMETAYIYTQVDMYWNISDYVREDYAIDYRLLTEHIGACIHALRKYLHGRIGS
jgi:GYF domain 2